MSTPKSRVTTRTFAARKAAGEPIVMVTAYDAPGARLADEAGVDSILVGDSLGMVVLGMDDTLGVTMDDMVRHTAAVARATSRAMVAADMPFMSFQVTAEEAMRNAARLVVEGGAQAVKVEGGRAVAGAVRRIVDAGIPVVGHVGLTPQSVHELGGYRTQAREAAPAVRLVEDCRALEEAGAFAVVLECIPAELAALVTRSIGVPSIGIGAGGGCDGQVQVFHDLLGLGSYTPKHARRYADLAPAVRDAIASYADDVRSGDFPAEEHCTAMEPRELEEVERTLGVGGEPSGSGAADGEDECPGEGRAADRTHHEDEVL